MDEDNDEDDEEAKEEENEDKDEEGDEDEEDEDDDRKGGALVLPIMDKKALPIMDKKAALFLNCFREISKQTPPAWLLYLWKSLGSL